MGEKHVFILDSEYYWGLALKLHLPRVSKTFNSILPSFQFEILATIGNIGFLRSEMHVVYHNNWKLRSKLRSGHQVSVAALVNPGIN